MFEGVIAADGAFGRIADEVLRSELPELPDERRRLTTSFVCRRASGVPEPLRLGLVAASLSVDLLGGFVGPTRAVAWVRRTSLPVLGELPRLIRALAVAHVWETWPGSAATGAPS